MDNNSPLFPYLLELTDLLNDSFNRTLKKHKHLKQLLEKHGDIEFFISFQPKTHDWSSYGANITSLESFRKKK